MNITNGFAEALQAETDQALLDPSFRDSPVQSQLLNYLCRQTIVDPTSLSQYTVAVEGLGRPDDYDLQSDSYPRVQISRLRKSLSQYYSLNRPVAGRAIVIKSGDYRLHLERVDQAYPLRPKKQPAAPLSEALSPSPSPTDSTSAQRPTTRSLVAGSPKSKKLLLAGMASVLAPLILIGANKQLVPAAEAIPYIRLATTGTGEFDEQTASSGLAERMARRARIQLSNSFVSRTVPKSDKLTEADYTVKISLGMSATGAAEAYLTLTNSYDRTLFTDSIPYTEDTTRFIQSVEAKVVYLTGPTGVVARDQMRSHAANPGSAYACFLRIESKRSSGKQTKPLVNRCLNRFPRSKYAAFWLGRRAFDSYQQRIVDGQPISKDHQEWADVQAALKLDKYNAFANFVAAKVELAENNCSKAKVHINRALERGVSYPTLIAASMTAASGCKLSDAERAETHGRITALAQNTKNPDPLLQVYLTLSALAIDDRELAVRVSSKNALKDGIEPVEQANEALAKALTQEAYFETHESEIDANIRRFVWNEKGRKKIVSAIGSPTAE